MIRQDWGEVYWERLKNDCPMDVSKIVNLAYDIEDVLNRFNGYESSDINKEDHEDMVQTAISLRSKINVLSSLFLKLLKKGFDDNDEKERRAYKQIQAAFSSLLRNLHNMEKNELRKGTTLNDLTSYVGTMDTILYGLIYYSLQDASSSTNDPEMFPIELWRSTRFSFDVFRYQLIGEEEKLKNEKEITYGDLVEGKNENKEKKEEKLREFEDKIEKLKKSDELFKSLIGDEK